MQKSYFQYSFTLKKELDLQKIPSNTRLFICDATSMYTNIKTGLSLHRIVQFALEHKEHLTVPTGMLMYALLLLMTNNVFQFGDTYWLQKVGTAMGAPPAPPWATIFFGIHEETVLARFGPRLQLYRRFIDDVLGIWLVDPDPVEDSRQWTSFVALMQDYYGLEWIFEEISKKVNYMYMTISIREDRIVTSLYEKSMNLYLYIPPHSAHPPGVLTGLVSGNILRIQSLCSKQDDIYLRMKEFYARLLVCGYQRDLMISAFTKGITGAYTFIKHGSVRRCVPDKDKDTTGQVFFHLTYHPRDPTSKSLQRQWRQHLLHPQLEPPLWRLKNKHKIPIGIKLMCVAYSRLKNLGNIFTYRKIDRLNGPPVSSDLE